MPPPPANPELFGHEEAERALLRAWQSGRLAHAWLIAGPRGIGKATFAYRAARFVLAGGGQDAAGGLAIDPRSGTFRRVAAGSHGNLRVLEPASDPRTGRRREEIVVEQVRDLGDFLHQTAAESGRWRVVIVDAADELNHSAANALLKALEEPSPGLLFLLVAHAESRLPATIRSRCHRLALRPLGDAVVTALLQRAGYEGEACEAVAALAGGSVGRALRLAAFDGLALYRTLIEIAAQGPPPPTARILEATGGLAARDEEAAARFVQLFELLAILFARLVGWAAGAPAGGALLADEERLARRLLERRALAHWLALWEKIARQAGRAERARLDRRQVAIAALAALAA